MNKATGILVIGLGLIMIVIGITGTQSQVLADLKTVNPKLRSGLGSTGGTSATSAGGTIPQSAVNAIRPGLAPTR